MQHNLTEGSVFRNILRFSLPYLLSYFLQTLYGMADLFIIGQYEGVAGTTAVSVGSQIMHMVTVIIVGLAMGATVSIAQAVGANDRDRVHLCSGNTITLFLLISIGMTLLLLTLVHPLLRVMSTPADALDGAADYLTICFLGIPFIAAYNVLGSIFRGMGDSKSPMYFITVACVANILLDYLFMGAMRMGPAGAALGTTLAQAISVLVSLGVILCRKSIRIQKSDLHPQAGVMRQLLRIGFPIACQDGLVQVAFLVITVIANRRGLTDAAAVGIVEKIIGFLFLVPSSLLSTVSALGAQNIGARKPERARQTLGYAIVLTVSFGVLVSILVQWVAEPLVALFTSDSAAIVSGGQYLRGYIIDCIFAGIHFCFSGYFCACGKSWLSFLHNILSISLVRIPGVWLTSTLFPQNLLPMGLATAAGSLCSVLVCVIAYLLLLRHTRSASAPLPQSHE